MQRITNQSQQQILQQRRAAHAWNCVEEVTQRDETFRKNYRSIVRSLPPMVMADGLGHTLAFLQAKAEGNENSPHGTVYAQLSSWMASQYGFDRGQFLKELLTQSSTRYRQFTTESLAYLQWLKRFTEAYVRE